MRADFEHQFRPDTWSRQPFHRRMLISNFSLEVGKVLMDHLEKTDGSEGRPFAACLNSCSCPLALQFRLPCAHMVHLREAAGLALSFNLNYRWTMAAFATSIKEAGLHEGPMHAWKPKKGKSSSPAEMLKTVYSLVNDHITVEPSPSRRRSPCIHNT